MGLTKFERKNSQTNKKETFIGATGTLVSFSDNSMPNKTSGKKYHRFTAKVDTPSGETVIGGQVYEGLIPHLGGTPQVGDKLQFAARLEDLQNDKNAYWGISGNAVDDISDDFLDAIANL